RGATASSTCATRRRRARRRRSRSARRSPIWPSRRSPSNTPVGRECPASAAVGPVGAVVGGEVVLVVAAGPAAAALIARFQEAAQSGRHGALAAADAELLHQLLPRLPLGGSRLPIHRQPSLRCLHSQHSVTNPPD